MPEQECIFCGIASGKIPAKKVFEDDKVVAVLDINPAVPGHLLVIPKEHVAVMPQMPVDLVRHVGVIAKKLSHELIKKLGAEGVSVFIANGGAAGQRAPHFMMHVIPRKEDDGVQLDPPSARIPPDQMRQVFDQLTPSVDKHFRGVQSGPKVQQSEKKEGGADLDTISDLLNG